MELQVLSTKKEAKGKVKLPAQFGEPLRADLIKRAVEVIQANTRQPYGANPEAGKRHSSDVSRRRRKYRGSYGSGISRVPRKVHSRSGVRMNWVGAFAPGCVGGYRAHPPKAIKIWAKKINKKERRLAIRSALSATVQKELVSQRGHKIPDAYPFIITEDFEKLSKTKDVIAALKALGFSEELVRAEYKKVRAGKGKMRGRKYKRTKGPLLVVGDKCSLVKAARNIPGIDVVEVKEVNTALLAPGSLPGRATLYTQTAIDQIEKNKLFM